ncbi:MAG: hypothetical protein ACXACG_05810 [Candidatus Thorarchaeota archaeon]
MSKKGPSKSEFLFLILLYPSLYFLSGFIHELGHIVGAIVSGVTIVEIKFIANVFSVSVNAFRKNLILTKLLGGGFQGMFFLIVSKRYRFLNIVVGSCFVYALAEAAGLSALMGLCAFVSEIVGNLIVIYYAW